MWLLALGQVAAGLPDHDVVAALRPSVTVISDRNGASS